MTQDEKIQMIWDEVKAARTEIHEVREHIVGDPLADPPKPGLVHVVQTHKHEIYGNEELQKIGMRERQIGHGKRIKALEGKWRMVVASSAAVSGSVILIYTLVKAFITKQIP